MTDVQVLDGVQTAQLEPQLREVFAEAFAEAPYGEGPADVNRAFHRFRSQARRTGFRAAVASDGGRVVGMAYGYPLSASTGWWDTVLEQVPAEVRREDGKRTFGLFELAVRPSARRHGVATAMHQALINDLDQQRVMLNTRPEATAAQAAYKAWGYVRVGAAVPWEGAAVHDVMVLDLAGSKGAGG